MKLIDKSALIAEIERRRKSNAKDRYFGRLVEDNYFLSFIDTIEVKEVQNKPVSIWHDANQQPQMYRKYLVRYSDRKVSGSWERHDNGFIPWKDVVKEHGFTHWCYVEDLLKL